MQSINPLNQNQWRDLMSYLLRVEDLAGLKNIKSKLIEQLKGSDGNEISTQIDENKINKESRDLELSEKENIAEDIYELAGGFSQYLGNGLVQLFESADGFAHIINLQKLSELDFIDSVKLTDMLHTDNLPSQVEAHYRVEDVPNSKKSMLGGVILLSDGDGKLIFNKQEKSWLIENSELSLSAEVIQSLSNLNKNFLNAVESDLYYSTMESSDNSLS